MRLRISTFLIATICLAACNESKKPTSEATTPSSSSTPAPTPSGSASAAAIASTSGKPSASEKASEAPIVDLVVGTGKEAKDGSRVKVHYDAFFTNGNKFETSRDRKPKAFVVGGGQVIKGWDAGVVGMKVGGKRKLTIPPSLAYGEKGSLPTIPPNATLVFEIELLEVQ